MKLVTFDDGTGRRLDGDEIAVLDVPTMREYFERGGAARRASTRSQRRGSARRSCRRSSSTPPATSASTRRSRSRSAGRTRSRPGSSSSRTSTRSSGPDEPVVYPEHLTEELDYELELAVVICGRPGKWFAPEEADGLHRRLRDLQRHHGARHPAARDALGRVLVLQGDRHVLPARPVDRHAGRDPGSARPGDGAARQRRAAAGVALGADERDDPGDPRATTRRSGTRPATCSRPARCRAWRDSREDAASLYLKPGDVMEAEIERIGVLRNPVVSWQEAHGEPPPPRVRW